VRRLFALLVGGFGLGALVARRRLRAAGPHGPSPADELRRRLAETKAAAEPEPEPEADPEPTDPEPTDPEPTDPETRRRELHERARARLDELG
jgi:hypothetical protein